MKHTYLWKDFILPLIVIVLIVALTIGGRIFLAETEYVQQQGSIVNIQTIYDQPCGFGHPPCEAYILTIQLTDGSKDKVESYNKPTCTKVTWQEPRWKDGVPFAKDLTCE